MKLSSIGLEFKIEDFWVGAFWSWSTRLANAPEICAFNPSDHRFGPAYRTLDVYVCFVPCLPIHIQVEWPTTMFAEGYEQVSQGSWEKEWLCDGKK